MSGGEGKGEGGIQGQSERQRQTDKDLRQTDRLRWRESKMERE